MTAGVLAAFVFRHFSTVSEFTFALVRPEYLLPVINSLEFVLLGKSEVDV